MIFDYEWIKWVFSGIGVFVISLIIRFIFKRKAAGRKSTTGDNSPIINGDKNKIKINNNEI